MSQITERELCQTLGICNAAIANAVITDRIKKVCPKETYATAYVSTTNHHFEEDASDIHRSSRKIDLQARTYRAILNTLCIIFRSTEMLNLNRVALGILGSENQEDQKEAIEAFSQNFSITIYVPMDGSENFEITGAQGTITKYTDVAATTIAQIAKSGAAKVSEATNTWCVIL